jgi:hypothetical protein
MTATLPGRSAPNFWLPGAEGPLFDLGHRGLTIPGWRLSGKRLRKAAIIMHPTDKAGRQLNIQRLLGLPVSRCAEANFKDQADLQNRPVSVLCCTGRE